MRSAFATGLAPVTNATGGELTFPRGARVLAVLAKAAIRSPVLFLTDNLMSRSRS